MWYFLNPGHLYLGLGSLLIVLALYEGVKLYRDRKTIAKFRTGDSSVNFFYEYKYQVFAGLYVSYNFITSGPMADYTPDLMYSLTILITYMCMWSYYYHLNVCQRMIAPLLEQFKTQMI